MNKYFKLLIGFCIGYLLTIDRQILVVPFNDFNVEHNIAHVVLIVSNLTFLLYCMFLMYKTENRKLSKLKILYLCLLDLFLLIGNSFIMTSDLSYIWDSAANKLYTIIFLILNYIVLKRTLIFIEDKVKNFNTNIKETKFIKLFDKHPFLSSFIIIMLFFSIYMIAFYPVMMSLDPSFQIKQFFNVETKYAEYVVLLDKSVFLTNHHPVVHTLLLGGCLKLGRVLLNDNFGLFIYSIIQCTFLAATLGYTIKYLKENKCSTKTRLIVLLIYSLVPMYGMYAMSAVKDTIYTCFIIWYVILLDKFVKNKDSLIATKDIALLIVVLLGIMLFRNNGIHVICLSLPFLIFYCKKNWKKLSIVLLLILAFNTTFNKVILPHYKITAGSVREALSIPFQQTARYVIFYDDELTTSDKKAISNILNYKKLARKYNPKLADPVKNDYNRYATKDDLKKYFKVWFKCFLKHPLVYIEATINNTYGYFSPQETNWYVYHEYYNNITEDNLVDYHYNNNDTLRMLLTGYSVAFPYYPIVGMLSNIGFNTWILLGLSFYSVIKKKKKYLIVLSPLLISLLVCVASPVNTYFRYTMPYVFTLPSLFALLSKRFKEQN